MRSRFTRLLPVAAACALVSLTIPSTTALAAAAVTSPASQSAQAGLVARITAQLARKTGVRAQFRQTRTLAALSAPLVSTGTLVFVRDRGVIWRTDTPYRITYVIGDAGVEKIDASGVRTTSSRSRGGIAQVSQMMRAMLGGDLSALYSQFDVAADGTPAKWHLLLTPNQPQLAQAVKSLRMEGGAFLNLLEITSANGDTTRIEFSGSEGIDSLPPAEAALFGAH
ncbi:outer membrane lipoprotein carrier protein LolA [Trinickia diaoshuihuensis]|uniref:outer membrane lipoprotein carrier protein LolA n=1 Tax=Trinickia diaoshuihuensis TaxID=2292265 RepID=UPI000E277590|nr:outer membrane lipoprotein carrier protein LolA [Trinickia diaoshuihuensis]